MLATTQSTNYEREIIRILHKLPAEQASHLLSYAHFLELQANEAIDVEEMEVQDEENEEEIIASEQKWDELFDRPEAKMLMEQMALEALMEEEQGLTTEMRFDKHGNLITPDKSRANISA